MKRFWQLPPAIDPVTLNGRQMTEYPLPPGELMYLSVNSKDPDKFLARGSQSHRKVIQALEASHFHLMPDHSILEWGCGCGRIARHFVGENVDFRGIDINAEAIAWCSENLLGRFSLCELLPPLDFPDESFDLIYAGSVVTHLSLDTQSAWMKELHRLLKPDGRLLLTFHGPFHIAKAFRKETFAFRHVNSHLFAESGGIEGSNKYAAYQTREATEAIFFPFATEAHFEMHDILGGQDTIVFGKRFSGLNSSPRGMSTTHVVLRSTDPIGRPVKIDLVDSHGTTVGTYEAPLFLPMQTRIIHIPIAPRDAILPSVSDARCSVVDIVYSS